MNLKKLFVVGGVLLMAGTSAMAAIVDGVRQKPEPTPTQAWVLSTDTTTNYYLYNVGAKAFFTEGNAWGTQASVGNAGLKVAFTVPTVNDVPETVDVPGIPEGVYLLNDYSLAKKAWKLVFFDSETAMFVDRGTQANFGWGVTPIPATNNFRIHAAAPSDISLSLNSEAYPNVYVGLDVTENAGNTALSPFLEEGEGHYIDWTFVTEDVYKAYLVAVELYNKAQDLKAVLDDAKAQGVSVSAQETVYLNESASLEEIEAAITAVKTAVATNASVATPIDMTSSISNPNFDNASYTGWKGTAPNMTGDGNHGKADVAEHYNKTFDTYQELTGMPTGVYMLSNNGFLRGWWDDAVNHTNYTAYLYAEAGVDTFQVAMANPWEIKNTESMAGATEFGTSAGESTEDREGGPYYAPNDPSAARLYFEKGYYLNKVFFAVEDGNVKLGVKKDVNRGSEWATFDNFKLTFYGNAAEAYQYWVSQSPKTDYTGAVVSEQYLNAYNAAFQTTASNKAEAKAAMAVIQAASDNIAKNSQLWAALKTKYAEAETKVSENQTLISAGDLSDYLNDGYYNDDQEDIVPYDILEAEEKTGDNDLSNEELQTVIDKITELIAAVDKELKDGLQPGTDVTRFIKNPGFEEGTTGWTIESKGGGNVQLGGNADNHCYEAWHSTNFNVYQEVSDLPVGVYEISVNGYMRYLDGQDAITHADEAPADVPIYVYMNDSKANFVSWLSYPKPASFYDEVTGATYLTGDEGSYPDNMIAASAAFLDGGYQQSAKCLVAEEGAVTRIGVKGTPEAKFWPIFDNFQLTYMGMDIDVVKPLLQEKVNEANTLANEMTTKSAKAAFTTALSDATTALGGEDGKAMFESIAKIEKAMSDLKEGRTLCQDFQATVQEFMAYASEYGSSLATEALQLGGTIQNALETCELDEADIEAYKLQIREYKLKMQLPADYAQGSKDGVDVTAFIQTPDFQKYVDGDSINAIDGWIGTAGYNFGNDATQKGAFALEFYQMTFDMYQDLAGVGTVTLPKGNYRLEVNAFERVSESTPAYLYALADNDTLKSVELKKHADGFNEREGEAGPGDMVSAKNFFNEGRYKNSIAFRFEGDTLRIGIKHEAQTTYDWIIMDDFKLFFHGDDYDGVETVINLGKPVQVQYFTLDGRQVAAPGKGIVIRKTIMDNGAVIVRKIQK